MKNESWHMKGKWMVQMKLTPCTNGIRISQHWRQCILCCPPARKGQLHTWLSNISHSSPTWQEGTRTITTAEMKCDPADQCVRHLFVQWESSVSYQANKWSSLFRNGVEMERWVGEKQNKMKQNSLSSLPYSRLNVLLVLSRLIKTRSHCACWCKAVFKFYLILVVGG